MVDLPAYVWMYAGGGGKLFEGNKSWIPAVAEMTHGP